MARLHGVSTKTVQQWCQKGLIPGVQTVERHGARGGTRYEIPDGAKRPVKKTSNAYTPPPCRGRGTLTQAEITAYIRIHASRRTYAQIKAALGISYSEIQRIYDRLHDLYGI